MAALTYIRQMKERERIVEKRNQRERRIKEENVHYRGPTIKTASLSISNRSQSSLARRSPPINVAHRAGKPGIL